MATTDTLCFGDADPVTGGPRIDGLTDLDFLPYNPATDFIEAGYVNGSRLTFAGSTLTTGGTLARVIFQGVRQPPSGSVPDRLVLGFMVRFNTTFHNNDFIVIAVRSQSGVATSPARMIVIKPNFTGTGADSSGAGSGNDIKSDKLGRDRDFYKFPPAAGTTTAWEQYSEDGIDIKVRSWRPSRVGGSTSECCWSVEVSLPRNAPDALAAAVGGPSDWINLNDDFGLYFAISRVNATAGTVSQVSFPTTSALLTALPDANFSVPQWGIGLVPALQTPVGVNTGVGVRFKNGELGVGRRDIGTTTTTLSDLIEGSGGTQVRPDNELVAIIENTATVPANDITAEFRFRDYGMGPFGSNAWNRPVGMIPNPTPRRIPTPLDPAVNLAPAGTAAAEAQLISIWPRADVPATLTHLCMWVQLSSATDVNFTQSSVRRNMNFDQLSQLERDAAISGVGYPAPPNGASEHDFVLETFCRPIVVQELIDQGQIPNPEMRALVLQTLDHAAAKKEGSVSDNSLAQNSDGRWRDSIIYLWLVFGYRRTGTFLTIDGRQYEHVEGSPGSFGISALHEGVGDNFSYAFSGPQGKLVRYQSGSYGLKVPHDGEIRIKFKLAASADGPSGDLSELPKVPWPGGDSGGATGPIPDGCIALVKRLIARFGIWGLLVAVLILLLLYWLFT
jgi:hypothetical protein